VQEKITDILHEFCDDMYYVCICR